MFKKMRMVLALCSLVGLGGAALVPQLAAAQSTSERFQQSKIIMMTTKTERPSMPNPTKTA